MLNLQTPTSDFAPASPIRSQLPSPTPAIRNDVTASLAIAARSAVFHRRVVRAGEVIYRAGDAFENLYIVDGGAWKMIDLTADGREQVVSFKFRSDWMGLDGIGRGRHTCDAVAMDTGAVWVARYDAIASACAESPALMHSLHAAMSRALVGDRGTLMSVCTLPADASVADFLHSWAVSLRERGMRCDQISLRLTRAEIGNFLGVTLETVSRALSRLVRANIIKFADAGRRDIAIPDVEALKDFVQRTVSPVPTALLH